LQKQCRQRLWCGEVKLVHGVRSFGKCDAVFRVRFSVAVIFLA
jgi:hypothetical protein